MIGVECLTVSVLRLSAGHGLLISQSSPWRKWLFVVVPPSSTSAFKNELEKKKKKNELENSRVFREYLRQTLKFKKQFSFREKSVLASYKYFWLSSAYILMEVLH